MDERAQPTAGTRASRRPRADAAAVPDDDAVAQPGAQPRRDDVDGVARVLRSVAGPQLVDRAVEVHLGPAVDEQQREERQHAAAR